MELSQDENYVLIGEHLKMKSEKKIEKKKRQDQN